MEYNTDVLIIGGGSAGYHAAIEARKTGANVLLVHKGGGNATIMAAGGFAGNFNRHDEVELEQINRVFVEDILKSGRYMNNEQIVKKLVKSSGEEIKELKNKDIHFIEDENKDFKLFQASGHTYPRTVRCLGGNTRQYYSILRDQALQLGVTIMNHVRIIDLIKRDGRICGAVGFSGSKLIFISCPSIILATGGISANYHFSTHKKTIQGNGLSMALKVGASLVDMEFIQFMPTVIAYPEKLRGLIVTDTLRGEGAILLNKNFERFMEKYAPIKKDMETRDKISKSIFQEICEGRGTRNNTVYLDARNIDRKAIKESFTNHDLLMKAGIDPKKDLIEIAPAAHYTCGGIKIDENAFTGVKGLWAVGEVTGGLHGANRLGSVALTENVVFGKLAGEQAGLYSVKNRRHIKDSKHNYTQTFEYKDPEKDKKIEERLRQILSNTAGIVRNEKDLSQGIEEIEKILDVLEPQNKKETIYNPSCIQIQSLALINYCIMKSCQMRKESRGTHFREDYPEERKDLLKQIIIHQEGDKILHHFESLNKKSNEGYFNSVNKN